MAATAIVTCGGAFMAFGQITIDTVAIGYAGNAADSTGYGAVGYTYNIGTHEVTNAQYTAFLNAVAATDTYNLYSMNMSSGQGGITRSGSSGSYTYQTISGRENMPVNQVSFWDAARFVNWLENGQGGAGTTETGTYTLNGVLNPVNTSVTRNANSTWAITSEDEWYKAAYYQPANAGGDGDDYWQFATQSNTAPLAGPPGTGGANFANAVGGLTAVGSYSASFFGAFDMNGNVVEWNETIITANGISQRSTRGGGFNSIVRSLQADHQYFFPPQNDALALGFRVSYIPGPSAVALLAIGGLGALGRRRSAGR